MGGDAHLGIGGSRKVYQMAGESQKQTPEGEGMGWIWPGGWGMAPHGPGLRGVGVGKGEEVTVQRPWRSPGLLKRAAWPPVPAAPPPHTHTHSVTPHRDEESGLDAIRGPSLDRPLCSDQESNHEPIC